MRLEKKYYAESHIKLEVNEKNCIAFGEDYIQVNVCIKVQTCYYEVEAKHD